MTLLVLATGGLAADAVVRVRDVRAEAYRAEAEMRRAQATVQSLAGLDATRFPDAEEIETALTAVRAAHVHFGRARNRLGYLDRVLPLVGVVPVARGAGEVPTLLDLGIGVTDAADELLSVMLQLMEPSGAADGGDESLAERLRSVFVDQADLLDQTLAELEVRRPEVAALRAYPWGRLLGAAPDSLAPLDEALAEVPRARVTFEAIRTGIDPLFGFDRPRTYLVAGLNESEIRPNGGFMGTLGIVTVDRGRLVSSEFDRVLAWERPQESLIEPPDDLRAMMWAGAWLLRDANWWPDFPTSAEAILDHFEINQGFRPDGVIALNTLFTGDLVAVFEPLELPEYPTTLISTNWRGVVENHLLVARGDGPFAPRDEPSAEEAYLHPLMQALVARSQAPSAEQLPALMGVFVEGSRSRDVQAYVADTGALHLLDVFGVTGRLDATPGPGVQTLAVVDSNVSWSKVGPGISRSTLIMIGQEGYVDIVMDWSNRVSAVDPTQYPRANGPSTIFDAAAVTFEPATGFFGNYVRVYVPQTAKDIRVIGSKRPPRIYFDRGFTIVGAYVSLSDGEDARLSVSYRDEAPAETIRVWKQGGLERDALRVLHNSGGVQTTAWEGRFESDVTITLGQGR